MEGIDGNESSALIHKPLYRKIGVNVIGMIGNTHIIKCENLL